MTYMRYVLISLILGLVDFSSSLLHFLLKVEKISVFTFFSTDFTSY